MRKILYSVLLITTLASLTACSKKQANLAGTVKIDGSSTVYPITQAIAEEFNKQYPDVSITVGISGTGGGFKKFAQGEIDINDASRKIKDEEAKKAKENGIDIFEFEVAYDGIAIVVNKENNWVDDITTEELKKIWDRDSRVVYWSDIRPEWPKEKIKLYGPGTDSGTFDYFTAAINGEEKRIRSDYTASEDDNVLVQGIIGDKYAMGFFGHSYYEENKDNLKALKVNGVEPTTENIRTGKYTPLSRPLFIYVNTKSLERPEVKEFVKFYLESAKDLVEEVGYVKLEDAKYEEQLNKVK